MCVSWNFFSSVCVIVFLLSVFVCLCLSLLVSECLYVWFCFWVFKWDLDLLLYSFVHPHIPFIFRLLSFEQVMSKKSSEIFYTWIAAFQGFIYIYIPLSNHIVVDMGRINIFETHHWKIRKTNVKINCGNPNQRIQLEPYIYQVL